MEEAWQLDLDGVALLRWPADRSLRRQLTALGMPRLLLLDPDQPVPRVVEPSEDWLRLPASADDVAARAALLRERAEPPIRPSLDDGGLLRVGDRWVAVSPPQVPVVSLLLEQFERVVRTDEVVEVYEARGGSSNVVAIRTLLGRIADRVAAVGLELVTIRQRGVMLRLAPVAEPLTAST